MNFTKVEKRRVEDGPYRSREGDQFGLFMIPTRYHSAPLKVVANEAREYPWDHVSVSLPNRCPMWEEMCFVKNLFWEPEECIVQFHPPESKYVNNVKFCLHLWKYTGANGFPQPPPILVGVKGLGVL